MSKFQSGIVIITCISSLSGEEVKHMIENLGLTFAKDFCVQGDVYPIRVPIGEEDKMAKRLSNVPGVTGVMRPYSFVRKN